jgi:flagellar basal-body rod protein FlgG
MDRSLHTAASGMQAQQTNIDIISNNLANINTTAYKKSNAHFSTLFSQVLVAPGAVLSDGRMSPNGVQIGLGVELSSTDKSFSMGSLDNTQDPLDVAIEGDGFFQVQMPDGTLAYTRDGHFEINGQTGEMVTSEGYSLSPSINLGDAVDKIHIRADGNVTVMRPGSLQEEDAGTIVLAKFANSAGLMERSGNMYTPTNSSGQAFEVNPGEEGSGRIRQYFLEQSNVKVVEEVVHMIAAQRAYEANSNAIKAADEMLQQANNLNA